MHFSRRSTTAAIFFGWRAMPFGALAAGGIVSALEPSLDRTAALLASDLVRAAACGALLVYALLRLRFDR